MLSLLNRWKQIPTTSLLPLLLPPPLLLLLRRLRLRRRRRRRLLRLGLLLRLHHLVVQFLASTNQLVSESKERLTTCSQLSDKQITMKVCVEGRAVGAAGAVGAVGAAVDPVWFRIVRLVSVSVRPNLATSIHSS